MNRYRIGIDAGGTKVACGLFGGENRLLDRSQQPTPVEADGPAFCDSGQLRLGRRVRPHAHHTRRGGIVRLPEPGLLHVLGAGRYLPAQIRKKAAVDIELPPIC